MPKHIHAELIHQWAEGAEIQHFSNLSERWIDDDEPGWEPFTKFRLKPKPKTIKYKRYIAKFPPYQPILGVHHAEFSFILPPGYEITHWIDTEWQEVEVPE